MGKQTLTQVGRALREPGIQLIPAYSPKVRSNYSSRTWQRKLPQELRIRRINTLEKANDFLRREYIAESTRRLTVESELYGKAFVPSTRVNLDRVFSIQSEILISRYNTVEFQNLILQIDRQNSKATLLGCRVVVYQHLDNTISIGFEAYTVGKFSAESVTARTGFNKPSFQSFTQNVA